MKRLLVLIAGCTLLALAASEGVFGQKNAKVLDIPEKAELPKLMEQLKDKDAAVRTRAAKLIGNFGQIQSKPVASSVPTLLEMIKKDENEGCRAAATEALGKIAS